MFARADAQEIKRLLNEPVGYFWILAEAAGYRLFARTQRSRLLADQQTSGQTRFAPGIVNSCLNRFHDEKLNERTTLGNPTRRSSEAACVTGASLTIDGGFAA
jgi:hypothetical protein